MQLPEHIAKRVRETIAAASIGKHPRHIDAEAAAHGAIALIGTLGALWMLRPDGSLWNVDDDTGVPLTPLPEHEHTLAIVYGVERYPWLAEVLPQRPTEPTNCKRCGGRGAYPVESTPRGGTTILCADCSGLGWVAAK
jgi:hypothetical protein